jgi:hypothetical protein
MSQKTVQQQLFEQLRRVPFQPIEIEFRDGRILTLEEPALAVGDDGAALLSETEGLVDFPFDHVRDLRVTPARMDS